MSTPRTVASLLPARFDRVFAMEPTVMDPDTSVAAGATLSADGESGVTGVLRRRAEFDDAAAAMLRPIYRQMAARAMKLIPGAQSRHFAGVGHCIAQQAPQQLLQALRQGNCVAAGLRNRRCQEPPAM